MINSNEKEEMEENRWYLMMERVGPGCRLDFNEKYHIDFADWKELERMLCEILIGLKAQVEKHNK